MNIQKISTLVSVYFRQFQVLFMSWNLLFVSFLPTMMIRSVFADSTNTEIQGLPDTTKDALKTANFSKGMINVANSAAKDTKVNWSKNDKEALRLLGYSDTEINGLSLSSTLDKKEKQKISNRVITYAANKEHEVVKSVKEDIIPGLASSVIGLAFSALFGLVVGFRCNNQPSGLTFAATAGSWLALELMIWKGYQIRKKDFNTLSEMGKVSLQLASKVEKAKKIIKGIERKFKQTERKNYNSFLKGQKTQLEQLRAIAKDIRKFLNVTKDRQFGALRSINESIKLAADTSRKKARNAKLAAIGYTAAAGLAAAEFANILNAGGACIGAVPTGANEYKEHNIMDLFLSTAYAKFATIGDLDKIGIPIGAGLAAAYLGFKQTWGHQVYSTAQGRAITFLVMAGLAAVAAVKLKKTAQFLDEQSYEMKIFLNAIEEKFNKISTTLPDENSVINELKTELLPKIDKIMSENAIDRKNLSNKISSRIGSKFDKVKPEIDKEKLKAFIKGETQFGQDDVNKTLQVSKKMNYSQLNTDDLKKKIIVEKNIPESIQEKILNFFIFKAWAKSNTSQSFMPCFKRSSSFLIMDENCSCRAAHKCNRSLYPQKMLFPKKSPFGSSVYQLGALVGKSSNSIFTGSPAAGVKGFAKVGSRKEKLDSNTRQIITQGAGRRIDQKLTGAMVVKTLKMMKPALRDYFKDSARASSSHSISVISPRGIDNIVEDQKKRIVPVSSRFAAFKASLRRKIVLAKALGNPSLSEYVEPLVQRSISEGKSYNYAKRTIIRDPHKDLFQLISKRYLLIQSQGRLKF